MAAINGKQKGKAGELESCEVLRSLFGWTVRRGQQYKGTPDSDDIEVTNTPALFWEVKRVEKLSVPKALARAVLDAGRKTAVLLHRPNRSEWMVTIRAKDISAFVHAITNADEKLG